MDNIRVSLLDFPYLGIPGFPFLDSPKKMLEFMDHMECYTHNPTKMLANQWIWPHGDSTLCRFFALEFAHGICTNQHLSCEITIICYCYVSYV